MPKAPGTLDSRGNPRKGSGQHRIRTTAVFPGKNDDRGTERRRIRRTSAGGGGGRRARSSPRVRLATVADAHGGAAARGPGDHRHRRCPGAGGAARCASLTVRHATEVCFPRDSFASVNSTGPYPRQNPRAAGYEQRRCPDSLPKRYYRPENPRPRAYGSPPRGGRLALRGILRWDKSASIGRRSVGHGGRRTARVVPSRSGNQPDTDSTAPPYPRRNIALAPLGGFLR